MNFNVTIDDFNKICRVCIYYDEKYELISLTAALKLLKACTSVQISETEIDELPQKICEECVKKLEYFYAFKEKCENSDHYLRQISLEAKQRNNENNSRNFLQLESVEVKTEYNSDRESTGQLEDSLSVQSEDDYPLNKFINKEVNKKESTSESKNKKESARRKKLGKKTIYECDECNKTFHYIFQLRKHKYSHNNEKHFACEHCPRSYKSRKSLRWHQLRIHNNRKESKDVDGLNPKFNKYKRLKEGYACDKCGKTFVFPYMVRNHQTVHTEEKQYSCEQCFKQFKRSIQLQQHYNRVHNEPPRDICNICGKTIKRIYMKRHMSNHEINRSFPCPECGKSCGKRSRLSEHMKIAHNQLLTVHKYLCTVCGKNVVSPKDLDNHMRVHTGERPYQCQLCEKNYKTSSSLNIHIRFTHNKERPFTCDICFKGFISNQKLNRHKQTHSTSRSYACIVCGKLYGYESVLKSHMKLSHKVFIGNNQNS